MNVVHSEMTNFSFTSWRTYLHFSRHNNFLTYHLQHFFLHFSTHNLPLHPIFYSLWKLNHIVQTALQNSHHHHREAHSTITTACPSNTTSKTTTNYNKNAVQNSPYLKNTNHIQLRPPSVGAPMLSSSHHINIKHDTASQQPRDHLRKNYVRSSPSAHLLRGYTGHHFQRRHDSSFNSSHCTNNSTQIPFSRCSGINSNNSKADNISVWEYFCIC